MKQKIFSILGHPQLSYHLFNFETYVNPAQNMFLVSINFGWIVKPCCLAMLIKLVQHVSFITVGSSISRNTWDDIPLLEKIPHPAVIPLLVPMEIWTVHYNYNYRVTQRPKPSFGVSVESIWPRFGDILNQIFIYVKRRDHNLSNREKRILLIKFMIVSAIYTL